MIYKFTKILFIISTLLLSTLAPTGVEARSYSSFITTNNFVSNSKNQLKLSYSKKAPAIYKNDIGNQTVTEIKMVETQITDSNTNTEVKLPESRTNPIIGTPSITISKIGLFEVALDYSSVTKINELDQKLLYSPLIDTLTSEPCTKNSSTYIMGHSEPADGATKNKPAVRIFKDLEDLAGNDIIELQSKTGEKCKYTIIGSEVVTTGYNGEISAETFNRLYFPQTDGNSILKIQTCVKGSATKRLIYTAIMQ